MTTFATGLDGIRSVKPEILCQWLGFITPDYCREIDPFILELADKYHSWIYSGADYGSGTFEEKLESGEISFADVIDEIIGEINRRFFEDADEE